MIYYNSFCAVTARNCASGCCTMSGSCATSPSACTYKYSDFDSNPTKYYFSDIVNSMCNSASRHYSSGCCTLSGSCATTLSTCKYRYSDYYTDPTKYSLTENYSANTSSTTSGNIGVIIGPVVGGVVLIFIIIGFIIQWRRRQALHINSNMSNTADGGTTIIMTNNTPQPIFGMNQPMAPYSQPMPINQPPFQQPTTQLNGQPIRPLYSQPMVEASYGLGVQAQQGAILY